MLTHLFSFVNAYLLLSFAMLQAKDSRRFSKHLQWVLLSIQFMTIKKKRTKNTLINTQKMWKHAAHEKEAHYRPYFWPVRSYTYLLLIFACLYSGGSSSSSSSSLLIVARPFCTVFSWLSCDTYLEKKNHYNSKGSKSTQNTKPFFSIILSPGQTKKNKLCLYQVGDRNLSLCARYIMLSFKLDSHHMNWTHSLVQEHTEVPMCHVSQGEKGIFGIQ